MVPACINHDDIIFFNLGPDFLKVFGHNLFPLILGNRHGYSGSVVPFKRDFIIAAPFLMQIWLFITPVLYPLSSVPERWQSFYMLNPMVGIVEGFRAILLRAETPALGPLSQSVLVTLVVLALAWPLFRWLSRYFADRI